MSYQAASGNIALGLYGGQVELWQTAPYIAPPSAPRAAPRVVSQAAPRAAQPDYACVRKRLAEAQAKIETIDASFEKADSKLRQQMSREQELKRSIADLESKCAYIFIVMYFHTNNFHV